MMQQMATKPLNVWLVDDDASIRWVLERALKQGGMVPTAFEQADSALSALRRSRPDVLMTDIRMPGRSGLELLAQIRDSQPELPVIVMTAHSDLDSAVAAYQGGAFEYLPKPFDIDQAVDLVRRAANQKRIPEEVSTDSKRIPEMLGQAPAMQEVFRAIGRLSRSSMTVLINGESGTGKELVARALHRHSPRAAKAFIALNTSAFTADLLESELFGHEKGSFTGADAQRRGRFEQADGGTLFLDEIGDCPAELQTRLLRVLDQNEIRRVGDNQPIEVDVRVIAATHHNLEQDVETGRFRRDLFYRLSVFTIRVPPLREHKEDIPALAQHILGRLSADSTKRVLGISAEAMERLLAHDYPGNVRELQNEIERAFALADADEYITPDLLSSKFIAGGEPSPPSGSLRALIEEYESKVVRTALEQNDGNQTRTATQLAISRRSLIDKMQRYGIK